MIHRQFTSLRRNAGVGASASGLDLDVVKGGLVVFAPVIVLPAVGYLLAGGFGASVGGFIGFLALPVWASVILWSGK